MPLVTLRVKQGVSSENDIQVEVKDNTFDYLQTSDTPTIRVSAYLDRDWPMIEKNYAELYLDDECPYQSLIVELKPGSRVRKNIQLPGAMNKDEQLILEVERVEIGV